MSLVPRRITICIPHWQMREMMTYCLRSIRKFSTDHDLEVIVVDNGSQDDSLGYLRSLDWIRLIERKDETPGNWPTNVFTAWDLGMRECTGEFFITMHSDVVIRRKGWLAPYLEAMDEGEPVAGVGAWKLELRHPLYNLQKLVVKNISVRIKAAFGRKRARKGWQAGHYPRDYCAMYRTQSLLDHDISFLYAPPRLNGGGHAVATRMWDAGLETRMFPVATQYRNMFHIAHGTAAFTNQELRHSRSQAKVVRRAKALLAEDWIRELRNDDSLDH